MQSEARKRANKKYNAKTYKNLAIRIRPEALDIINGYCQRVGMSKASAIVNAIKYCSDNNIDLSVEPDQE